jgi:hypothetical protein
MLPWQRVQSQNLICKGSNFKFFPNATFLLALLNIEINSTKQNILTNNSNFTKKSSRNKIIWISANLELVQEHNPGTYQK